MNVDAEKRSALRLASVLTFIGLPALFVTFSILNLVEAGEDRFAIAERGFQADALTRRLNAPAGDGKPLDLTPLYIDAQTRSLASAALQRLLVEAISESSGRLIETVGIDPDPANEARGPEPVDLRATLDIGNEALRSLLHRLESGVPILDVTSIAIRRLANEDDDGQESKLRVDMAIRGYREAMKP